MKKILITGGARSFAKELSIALSDNGHQVYGHGFPHADSAGATQQGMEDSPEDLTSARSIDEAVEGMDVVIHLAGLLPPDHDERPETASATPVLGTGDLVEAIVHHGRKARLVLFSTTATYGDTTGLDAPVTTETTQHPNSAFARSLVEAEQQVLSAGIPYTILRVAPMVPAAPMDQPSWPFVADQRVELVYRGDVVRAVVSAVEKEEASNRILIIAGGLTWQMEGRQAVKEILQALNLPLMDARFAERPLYTDWYDTTESQRILIYQDTSFPTYLELLTDAVDKAGTR